jgi:hypothetical protein
MQELERQHAPGVDEGWHRSPVSGSVRKKADRPLVLLSGHQAVTHRAVSDKPAQGHQGEGLPIPGEYPAALERLASFQLPTIEASRAPLRNDRQECVGIQWNAAHEVLSTR